MTVTLLIVLWGVLLLGGTTGFLGVIPFLRQQSLLGDALSHAMLPGIVCAFLISHKAHHPILLCGSIVAGLLTAWFFMALERYTHLKRDAILGILLSSLFGFGLLLITVVQKKAYAHSAVIQRFFFGNASTIVQRDIVMIGVIGIVCIGIIVLLWKEIQLFLFDAAYARSLGYPVVWLERLLTGIFIIALALGLPLAGVILMSSFLIAPAAAARQWVNSVRSLCIWSTLIGASAGVCGALISSYYSSLPTGPTIVVCLTITVFFSLICSPSRGLMRYWLS